jgi:hypothetical protein
MLILKLYRGSNQELESEYSDLVQVSADVYGGAAGGGSSNQKPDETINEIVDNPNI